MAVRSDCSASSGRTSSAGGVRRPARCKAANTSMISVRRASKELRRSCSRPSRPRSRVSASPTLTSTLRTCEATSISCWLSLPRSSPSVAISAFNRSCASAAAFCAARAASSSCARCFSCSGVGGVGEGVPAIDGRRPVWAAAGVLVSGVRPSRARAKAARLTAAVIHALNVRPLRTVADERVGGRAANIDVLNVLRS